MARKERAERLCGEARVRELQEVGRARQDNRLHPREPGPQQLMRLEEAGPTGIVVAEGEHRLGDPRRVLLADCPLLEGRGVNLKEGLRIGDGL